MGVVCVGGYKYAVCTETVLYHQKEVKKKFLYPRQKKVREQSAINRSDEVAT